MDRLTDYNRYCWAKLKKEWNPFNGYDAGFIKDEYECNLDKCECAHFNQTVISKIVSFLKTFTQTTNSGHIAVSEKSFHRLMNIIDNSNAASSDAHSKSTFKIDFFGIKILILTVISYLTITFNKKYRFTLCDCDIRICSECPFILCLSQCGEKFLEFSRWINEMSETRIVWKAVLIYHFLLRIYMYFFHIYILYQLLCFYYIR